MKRAELRRQMREQRAAMRAAVARMKGETRAQLEKTPTVQRERKKRRNRRAGSLVLLLLLLLFVRCDCDPPPPPPEPEPLATDVVVQEPEKKKPTPPVKPKRKPFTDTVATQPRGQYGNDVRPPPSWLEEFRIQVAARSPRLAQCFTGTDRPGALRWAAAGDPKSGEVSYHELEPLGTSTSITREQR